VSTEQARRPKRFPYLPACLAAIILGILGMQTCTHHEPLPTKGAGQHAQTATPVADGSAGLMTHATAATTGYPAAGGIVSGIQITIQDRAHTVWDMVMLCAAMLVGVAASALLTLRLRRSAETALRGLRRLHHIVQALVPAPVGTGPPNVWEFSVVRC
jgi:hypothetical protein